jgi:hypothetical protein
MATDTPLLPYVPLTKPTPFPARRFYRTASRVLELTASYERERLSKPNMWPDRPVPPESLGKMLQQLALKRPVAVIVIESLAAEMLAQLNQ